MMQSELHLSIRLLFPPLMVAILFWMGIPLDWLVKMETRDTFGREPRSPSGHEEN